jgi:hypothetical protein
MIRYLFAFLLLIHGLIHLMGFIKEFQLAEVNQVSGKTLFLLSGSTGKLTGILGMATCTIFFLSAVFFLLKKDWWWMVGLFAIILSQIFILAYRQDTIFGTILNIAILLAVIVSCGQWSFDRMVRNELETLLLKVQANEKNLTREMIRGLPPVVQKWLIKSNVVGKPMPSAVHLKQKGQMRTKADGSWMPVEAEQYFTLANPGFIWVADVKAAPLMHLAGRDRYMDGKGHMLIKFLSLFPIADSKGKQIDQGTLLRYLAETVWFPSAAVRSYITWEDVDSTSAKATMRFGGVTASGIFQFTGEGDVSGFEAQRYYDHKEGAALETWLTTSDKSSYSNFEGIRVPARASVTWRLKTGDFTWYQVEITDIKYNTDNYHMLH